ncbi:MAG: DUF2065 domain-containing protein [Gammaproteobacteria bacterium]|nr:DUF2065 domain-containing protein [Gammaproteobacteria bacterium]
MWQELWVALALMLIIEGLILFLSPSLMRQALITMAQTNDRNMRIGGLLSMIFGLIVLYAVK